MGATAPLTPSNPLPIEQFNNSKLRDSITTALDGVPLGHGNAIFDITNKGAGVMVVHRFEDPILGAHWAAVGAFRFNRDDNDKGFQVALRGSW